MQSRSPPLIHRSHGTLLTALGFHNLLYLRTPGRYVGQEAALATGEHSGSVRLQRCPLHKIPLDEPRDQSTPPPPPPSVSRIIFKFCEATLGVAVASVVIAILTHLELSHDNTAQVVGYKFGSAIGVGFLSWLSRISLTTMYEGLDMSMGVYTRLPIKQVGVKGV
ncbi:unnamed protein product [Mesocestoides corti]|uniref:Uncharacterized protein n=1 Tax=Mesocestoides corti TaxID=53468 RepID=A0A3P6HCK0_MESCO|nr:unnamed protein product [Mesocestoides corti]